MIDRHISRLLPSPHRPLLALLMPLALLAGLLLSGRPALAAHPAVDSTVPYLSVAALDQDTCSQMGGNAKRMASAAYATDKVRTNLPAAIIAPVPPAQVLIAETAGGVSLAWSEEMENSAYEVWRSNKPYFYPQDAGSKLLTTTTLTAYTDDTAVRGHEAYYVVRGVNTIGEVSAPSYAVGRFPLKLTAGQQNAHPSP